MWFSHCIAPSYVANVGGPTVENKFFARARKRGGRQFPGNASPLETALLE